MFTFYAEIPTKNLIIEVPNFSEDQEAFSTYTPAKFDASLDFKFTSYEFSNEFEHIGSYKAQAPEWEAENKLESSYSYEPIYAENSESGNAVTVIEEPKAVGFLSEAPDGSEQQRDLPCPQIDSLVHVAPKNALQVAKEAAEEGKLADSDCESSVSKSKKGRSRVEKFAYREQSHTGLRYNQAGMKTWTERRRPEKALNQATRRTTCGYHHGFTEQQNKEPSIYFPLFDKEFKTGQPRLLERLNPVKEFRTEDQDKLRERDFAGALQGNNNECDTGIRSRGMKIEPIDKSLYHVYLNRPHTYRQRHHGQRPDARNFCPFTPYHPTQIKERLEETDSNLRFNLGKLSFNYSPLDIGAQLNTNNK